MRTRVAFVRTLLAATSLSLSIGLMPGCGGDDDGGGNNNPNPTPTATPEPGIEEFVSDLRVSGTDIVAVVMSGNPPAESGGPVIMAPDSATVNPGITIGPVPITSQGEFTRLLLEIPGSEGFWVLDFGSIGGGAGAGGTNLEVDVTFGPNPPAAEFDCLFSGSEGGAVGPEEVTSITIEECTVADFCDGSCDPIEAVPCAEYCELPIELPSCILEASAPVVCSAVVSCQESETCSTAGQCVEEVTSGAISAACAQNLCELLESSGSEF